MFDKIVIFLLGFILATLIFKITNKKEKDYSDLIRRTLEDLHSDSFLYENSKKKYRNKS